MKPKIVFLLFSVNAGRKEASTFNRKNHFNQSQFSCSIMPISQPNEFYTSSSSMTTNILSALISETDFMSLTGTVASSTKLFSISMVLSLFQERFYFLGAQLHTKSDRHSSGRLVKERTPWQQFLNPMLALPICMVRPLMAASIASSKGSGILEVVSPVYICPRLTFRSFNSSLNGFRGLHFRLFEKPVTYSESLAE